MKTGIHAAIVGWAAALALALAAGAAWSQEGEDAADWCRSDWGPEDEIGAANRLTPEHAARAAGLVREGRSYALGVETNASTPAFGGRSFRLVINQPGQAGGATLGPGAPTYNDDAVMGNLGVGSQIDGLGHVGIDHVYYNCHAASEFAQSDGLTRLGVENIPPIVTRGVLLDMTAHYGADPVPAGTAFGRTAIVAQAKAQGVEIGDGDVVLFHTGWLAAHGDDAGAFLAGEPGVGLDGARYLADLGVVAVGADNWGVEVSPDQSGNGAMAVHRFFLAESGIYILEVMNTTNLAGDGVSEFMFVLGTPRYTGAVQAIINPVAIR